MITIDTDWFPIEEIGVLTQEDLKQAEILFDTGHIVKYFDNWPFAIATHYRIVREEEVGHV